MLTFMSLVLALAAAVAAAAPAAQDRTVTVCHVPPGNPGNSHTIEVSASALDAHLAHGDSLGECPPGAGECRRNADCAPDEYCAKPDGDCDARGRCEVRPTDCPQYCAPVCGCDGNSYYNSCAAAAAGASVEHEGPCT